MVLILIEGNRGSGKTNLSTLLAKHSEVPILSNYKLKLPQYKELDFMELADLNYPCLVLMDEAYVYLESRVSGKEINRYLSYILFQSRKRSIDFILTVQLGSTIDLRWRELADYVIKAHRIDLDFYYDVWRNNQYIDTWRLPFAYAEENIFPLYDTLERIETAKDLSKEFSLIEPKNEEKAIMEIIGEMREEMPLRAWTKPMIEDLIFEKRWPNSYAKKVHARAKRIMMQEKLRGEV